MICKFRAFAKNIYLKISCINKNVKPLKNVKPSKPQVIKYPLEYILKYTEYTKKYELD